MWAAYKSYQKSLKEEKISWKKIASKMCSSALLRFSRAQRVGRYTRTSSPLRQRHDSAECDTGCNIGRNLNETFVLLIRPYTLFAFTMGVIFIRRPRNPASRTYFKLYSSQQFVHWVVTMNTEQYILNSILYSLVVNPIPALAQKVCSSRRVFQAKVHARLRTLIAGQQLPLFVCLNSCFIDATATACNYSGSNARTNWLRHVLHVLLNSCIVQRTFLTQHAVKMNYKRYVRGNGLSLLVKWRVYVYETRQHKTLRRYS